MQQEERGALLKRLILPPAVSGQLFIGSMPGSYEPFTAFVKSLAQHDVSRIVCLVPREEVKRKSPLYWEAWQQGTLPCPVRHFPIEDHSVPPDRQSFLEVVVTTAGDLWSGRHIIAHCGGGIGRSGTFAASVLLALGASREEAIEAVHRAGSSPQTKEQSRLVDWVLTSLALQRGAAPHP